MWHRRGWASTHPGPRPQDQGIFLETGVLHVAETDVHTSGAEGPPQNGPMASRPLPTDTGCQCPCLAERRVVEPLPAYGRQPCEAFGTGGPQAGICSDVADSLVACSVVLRIHQIPLSTMPIAAVYMMSPCSCHVQRLQKLALLPSLVWTTALVMLRRWRFVRRCGWRQPTALIVCAGTAKTSEG